MQKRPFEALRYARKKRRCSALRTSLSCGVWVEPRIEGLRLGNPHKLPPIHQTCTSHWPSTQTHQPTPRCPPSRGRSTSTRLRFFGSRSASQRRTPSLASTINCGLQRPPLPHQRRPLLHPQRRGRNARRRRWPARAQPHSGRAVPPPAAPPHPCLPPPLGKLMWTAW